MLCAKKAGSGGVTKGWVFKRGMLSLLMLLFLKIVFVLFLCVFLFFFGFLFGIFVFVVVLFVGFLFSGFWYFCCFLGGGSCLRRSTCLVF